MDENKCNKSENGEHTWVEDMRFGRVCKSCGKVEVTVASNTQEPIISPYLTDFDNQKEQIAYEQENNLVTKEMEYLLNRTDANGVIILSFKNTKDIFNSPMKMSSLGIDRDQMLKAVELLEKIRRTML